MARCANCTHEVEVHALNGCLFDPNGRGCACPFDFNNATGVFNAQQLPVGAPNQGIMPCQVCEGIVQHHEDCPRNLQSPTGGCSGCNAAPMMEHSGDCEAWSMLGKTWIRLRREESDRFIRNVSLGDPCAGCPHPYNWHVPGGRCAAAGPTAMSLCGCLFEPRMEQVRVEEEVGEAILESQGLSARDSQVGGEHYAKHKIQVWDIWNEYDLGAFEGAIIKYLLRDKGSRLEDLKKARHTLDRLIEIEEAKEG